MTNKIDKELIKSQLLTKWQFVDETLLDNALIDVENENKIRASKNQPLITNETILNSIHNSKIDNSKPIASNLFANLVINHIFHKNHPDAHYDSGISARSVYAKLPNLQLIISRLLAQDPNTLFAQMMITHFNLYNFGREFDGDITLKNKLDFEVLRKLHNDKEISLKDTQLDLYNKDGILIKNLLLNDDKIILQSNSVSIEKDSSVQASLYFYTYAYLNGIITFSMLDPEIQKQINGFSLINNNSNKEFSITNFPIYYASPYFKRPDNWKGSSISIKYMEEIPNQLNHSNLYPLFGGSFNNLYKNYQTWLSRVFEYEYNPEVLQKDDIQSRLEKENEYLKNAKVDTQIKDNKDFSYYKDAELDEFEKQYKFVEKVSLSPSQLNSYTYNLSLISKDSNLNSLDSKDKEFIAMVETVANKYNLTLTSEQKKVLANILTGLDVNSDEISLPFNKQEFSEDALTRMDFGNQCEEVILNHYAFMHPEKNIKVDKKTLKSNKFNVNFDIDGYSGSDLNRIDQVIEIKNSASPTYFNEPQKIVDAYKLQMIYYNELLHPKNGVKMLASLSQGKTTKFYEYDFKPNEDDLQKFYDLIDKSKSAYKFLVANNLFNFNDEINKIRQDKHLKATGIHKTFDIKKELLEQIKGKQNGK